MDETTNDYAIDRELQKSFRIREIPKSGFKAGQKSPWTKIYSLHQSQQAHVKTMEELGNLIGRLLDETQLQRAADWAEIKIEITQHNDRLISATIKCAE